MRIVTWNVNSLRVRPPRVLQLLAEHQPDVLCLREWWDYRAGSFHKGLGMRIDLALVSAGLADRLRACGIDREYRKGTKPSDHAPLLLDLPGAAHS